MSDKDRRSKRDRRDDKQPGPYGAFGSSELADIHHQSSEDVLKALSASPMKASKKGDPKKKSSSKEKRAREKARTEEKEKARLLRRAAREEQKRADELVGLLNLKEVPTRLKVAFTKALQQQQAELFEFLFTTIAPMSFSVDPAVADATEAIKMLTGAQDVEISTTRMRAILTDLIDLKTLAYMSRKLKLGHELRQKIIDKHFSVAPGSNKSTEALRSLLAEKIRGAQDQQIRNVKPKVSAPVVARTTRSSK